MTDSGRVLESDLLKVLLLLLMDMEAKLLGMEVISRRPLDLSHPLTLSIVLTLTIMAHSIGWDPQERPEPGRIQQLVEIFIHLLLQSARELLRTSLGDNQLTPEPLTRVSHSSELISESPELLCLTAIPS